DDGHAQVAAVGDGDVQLPAGDGAGDAGLAGGVVGDGDLAREDVPVAVPPQLLAGGVLGRDPAEQPLALAAGVESLVLGPLGGVEVAAHHELTGVGAWPALTEQAPRTQLGLRDPSDLGPALKPPDDVVGLEPPGG